MNFKLDADFHRLRIPSRRLPRFVNGLWKHTCFEVFVARKGSRAYREYNLSPSGEWASYAFAAYRKRLPWKPARPQLRVRRDGVDVSIKTSGQVRIGLAAVIEEKRGALSYWALRHPPGKPDFHHRRAFAMELA